MSFPRYSDYKDSGVEWLGEVPGHWSIAPLKWQLSRNDGGVWGEDPDGEGDTIVLRSTDQSVDGKWQIDDPATRKLSPSEKAAALLREGDLLITKSSGSSLHIGKTTLVDASIASMECCFSNFNQRIRLRGGLEPSLVWYFFNSRLARSQLDILSNSTTGLANLNGGIIGQLLFPLPPLPEQSAIAAFLDRETAKIDALVAEQERLIALLKEKRQAVISHAVTKGLDPNVRMKDSGVEWLGEVPEHWRVVPLSHAIGFQEGPGIMAVDFRDAGIPLLRVSGVQGRWASLEGCNYLDPEQVDRKWSHFRVKVGDLLVSASASMGTICEVGAEASGAIPYTGIIRMWEKPDHLTRDFVRAIMGSTYFSIQADLFKAGATIQHFGPTHLRQMKVILPPKEEQDAITVHIDQQVTGINELIHEAENAASILRERRSALISAAVTGKIDVRSLVQVEEAA